MVCLRLTGGWVSETYDQGGESMCACRCRIGEVIKEQSLSAWMQGLLTTAEVLEIEDWDPCERISGDIGIHQVQRDFLDETWRHFRHPVRRKAKQKVSRRFSY